jgi:hypothetical protein
MKAILDGRDVFEAIRSAEFTEQTISKMEEAMAHGKITRGIVDRRSVAPASKGIQGGSRPNQSKTVSGAMSGAALETHGVQPNKRSKIKSYPK